MKKIAFGNVRDFCSPVANLFGDVLVKKSVAVLQRKTEIFYSKHIFHRRLSLPVPDCGAFYGLKWRIGRAKMYLFQVNANFISRRFLPEPGLKSHSG